MSKESEGKGGEAGAGSSSAPDDGKGWQDIEFKDIEVGRKIGGGGFAIVHEGRWRGDRVALKTLFDPKVDEKIKKEYMDELHCMRHLDHPNVVKFLGACVKPPNMCIVMELCQYSMFHLLHNTRTPLPQETLVDMAAQTASAMAYLHEQTPVVIHRDLKSHNLLVSEVDGKYSIKLCDFGLVSNRETTAGTPNYMAPELLNDKPFSKKCDVYAFALVLWEFFSRQIPFDGWTATDIRDSVLRGERPDLPARYDCPDIVRDLIRDCWKQDPSERPEFADMARQLGEWRKPVSALESVARGSGGGGGGGDSLDALLGM